MPIGAIVNCIFNCIFLQCSVSRASDPDFARQAERVAAEANNNTAKQASAAASLPGVELGKMPLGVAEQSVGSAAVAAPSSDTGESSVPPDVAVSAIDPTTRAAVPTLAAHSTAAGSACSSEQAEAEPPSGAVSAGSDAAAGSNAAADSTSVAGCDAAAGSNTVADSGGLLVGATGDRSRDCGASAVFDGLATKAEGGLEATKDGMEAAITSEEAGGGKKLKQEEPQAVVHPRHQPLGQVAVTDPLSTATSDTT